MWRLLSRAAASCIGDVKNRVKDSNYFFFFHFGYRAGAKGITIDCSLVQKKFELQKLSAGYSCAAEGDHSSKVFVCNLP